jgi:ABC-2 type transport system ATP-binding protein
MEKIKVQHLQKLQNKRKIYVINDVSLTVHSGEIFALCGGSGSGKTVITKTLQRLQFPDDGTIELDRDSVGTVIQEQQFDPAHTVLQTMLIYSRLNKRVCSEAEVLNILNLVGLSKRRGMQIKNLNASRMARLKIAIAIVARPAILIMDAPFAGLSEYEARHVRVIFKTLADRFDTAILLTHSDFSGIEEIFDTTAVIDNGKIMTTESYNNLARRENHLAKTCFETSAPNLLAKMVHETFGFKTSLFGANEVIVDVHPDEAQRIYTVLKDSGVPVTHVTRVNRSIAELFPLLQRGRV